MIRLLRLLWHVIHCGRRRQINMLPKHTIDGVLLVGTCDGCRVEFYARQPVSRRFDR